MRLRRFWVRFERIEPPTFLNLGCGVTALDQADALALLEECLVGLSIVEKLPRVDRVIEGVTFDDLDQNHVAPNVGNMADRGVWFPAVNNAHA
ncbi:MAG: hypothetical protein KIS68_11810 [Bauldia sp.]|nr:hypothetical protein [Bauldia sp.]